MTREEILTKAIAIAKRNGFDISDDFFTETPTNLWLTEGQDLYFSLIFCHDFAKTFFGNNQIVVENFENNAKDINLMDYESPVPLLMTNRENIRIPSWQYNLIQMSLSEDPLIYLYNFIIEYEQAELN